MNASVKTDYHRKVEKWGLEHYHESIMTYEKENFVRCECCKILIKCTHQQHFTRHLNSRKHKKKMGLTISTRVLNIINHIFKTHGDKVKARALLYCIHSNTPVSNFCKNKDFFHDLIKDVGHIPLDPKGVTAGSTALYIATFK